MTQFILAVTVLILAVSNLALWRACFVLKWRIDQLQ